MLLLLLIGGFIAILADDGLMSRDRIGIETETMHRATRDRCAGHYGQV